MEHQEVRDYLTLRGDKAAEGEEAASSKLSEAKYHTILLLEEQRNQILSEARSEMNMQELMPGSADMALRESHRQVHCHRMELHQANQKKLELRQSKSGSMQNWRIEPGAQETRSQTLQETEELRVLLGTIALGGSLFWYGTLATLVLCPSRFIKEADTSMDTIDVPHKFRGSVAVPCIKLP